MEKRILANVAGKSRLNWRENGTFWVLIGFLLLVFLTGGASRADVASLIILRPLSVLVCGYALWSLTMAQVRANRFLFGMAAAIFALVGLHLVPLPPTIWGALPGREIISEIDRVAGLGAVWRPLTMVPPGGWNAFYSLFVPLAVLLLGVQLTREQRFALLPWVIGLGLFSGFWGLMQVVGDPNGPLYLYRVTNNGAAVGLFANRNHQAVLLAMLFPMLAVYASTGIRTEEQAKLRGGIALAAGAVLIPLLLVTGSRAGLVVGVLGMGTAAWYYRRPTVSTPRKRKVSRWNPKYALAAFGVIVLAGLTTVMSRAEAFSRLMARDPTEDLRLKMWAPIGRMAWKYFPVGSGAGSFVEVFQIDEPVELLKPSYVNHAHNDWLELILLFGLPGSLLLFVLTYGVGVAAATVWRDRHSADRGAQFTRCGAAALIIVGLASAFDYPLRTPIHASLFVIAALWLTAGRSGPLSEPPTNLLEVASSRR